MWSSAKPKVLLLPFARPMGLAGLESLEHALAFALQHHPGLQETVQLKNMVQTLPSLPPSTDFASKEMLQVLDELAQVQKAALLVIGQLTVQSLPPVPEGTPVTTLELDIRGYETAHRRYAFTLRRALTAFAPGFHYLETLRPTNAGFQSLVTLILQGVRLVLPSESWQQGHQQEEALTRWFTLEEIQVLLELEKSASRKQKLDWLHQWLSKRLLHQAGLVRLHYARLLKGERHYAEAAQAFEQALATLPAEVPPAFQADLYTEAGLCYALADQHNQGLACWESAALCYPDEVGPYINIAHTLEEQDQLDAAVAWLIRGQVVAPTDARLCYSLARIYARQNRWQLALSQYQLQLLLTPEDPWCYSNIAMCYLHQNNDEAARQYLEKTAQLDPHGEAGQYAALILAGMGTEVDPLLELNAALAQAE